MVMKRLDRGAALIDLVFACGLIGLIAAIAVPAIHASRDRDAARAAARYVAHRLQTVRLEALRRNVCVAIRFDPIDIGRFGVYIDGDGDGVLQTDVDGGTDRTLTADARLADSFETVAFRIANDVPDPESTAVLSANSDPLRLGSSNFLSFSPLGSSTSGTLYLAAPTGPQMAVRIMGATGRMRVLRFDPAAREWRDE
jgi:Tfp pilus assembly protein FimT